MNGISVLNKETQGVSLPLPPCEGTEKRWAFIKQEGDSHQTSFLLAPSSWISQPPRSVRESFLFISLSVYSILLPSLNGLYKQNGALFFSYLFKTIEKKLMYSFMDWAYLFFFLIDIWVWKDVRHLSHLLYLLHAS